MNYIYPKLPAVKDLIVFRIGGSGLANCLFIYARAIILSKHTGKQIITPTWFNFSLGTYLRFQSDKRHYLNLFQPEISIIRKIYLLIFFKKKIDTIEGLNDYFIKLKGYNELIRNYLYDQLSFDIRNSLPSFDNNVISIHVRLGDYPQSRRVPISWYIEVIKFIQTHSTVPFKFYLFSDGSNEELSDIIAIDNVERKAYGNAFIDMWAMSQSRLIIASDSTFSAWSSYLNQVPIIFYKRHFPSILDDEQKEIIIADNLLLLENFISQYLRS